MLDTAARLRAEGFPEDLWLRLFHPWLFRPGFFDDPANVPTALEAALAYPHRQPAAAFRAQVAALAGFDASALPARIAAPVAALLGAEDLFYPPTTAAAALAAFPAIEIRVIADAGHALHWDQPQAVAAALRDILERPSP